MFDAVITVTVGRYCLSFQRKMRREALHSNTKADVGFSSGGDDRVPIVATQNAPGLLVLNILPVAVNALHNLGLTRKGTLLVM